MTSAHKNVIVDGMPGSAVDGSLGARESAHLSHHPRVPDLPSQPVSREQAFCAGSRATTAPVLADLRH